MSTDLSLRSFPPGPKGAPLVGSLFDFRRSGTLDFYRDVWRQYGDVSSATVGPVKFFVVVRPEHIQHVLVKNPDKYVKGISHEKLRVAIGNGILTLEGEKWYRQRKLMQPVYTPKGIRPYAEIMTDESQHLIERWRTQLPPDRVVDINQEMTRVTMKVISRAMFGIDMDENFRDAARALIMLLEYTSASTNTLIDMPLFIPTPTNQRLKHAKRVLREFLMNIIQKRRQEGLQDDLLSMLMSSKDEETGATMTDEHLHDEALITFFAGHETTASLLTWTWYLLSKNPRVEAKLHAELAQKLQGRTPTLDDLSNLPYTRMVLDDALRLYSPVPLLARDAAMDDELAGYRVPKGTMVVVMPYATHRHPDFWEKPLEFYPEHFEEAAVAKRPRYAYFPFGSGQRICIGLHFAHMEAALILADVAQRFQLRMAEENDGKLMYVGVARPLKPIKMKVTAR